MMIGVYSVLAGVVEDTFLQNSECMIGESFDSRLVQSISTLIQPCGRMHCRQPAIQISVRGGVMTPKFYLVVCCLMVLNYQIRPMP